MNSASIKKWPLSMEKGVDLAVLAVAFSCLFLFLSIKPLQHDEGVNGVIIESLTSKGFYKYDPAFYHGPLHFYILFFFKTLLGRSEWALRLPAVLFSFSSIFIMLRLSPYLGRFTAVAGALFTAVSPGIIFYSRYAIHESTLFFFSVLTLYGFLRLRYQNDRTGLWCFGMGMTGMILTKETYVLSVGCFLIAWLMVRLYERFVPSLDCETVHPASFGQRDVLSVLAVAVFLILAFYTGFFMKWDILKGMVQTYKEWFVIGQGADSEQKGHWKYFFYWLELFSLYEWAALAGMISCYFLFAPANRWCRVLGLYALGHLFVYSFISYKTPWCIMQMIWPFLFAAGYALSLAAGKGGRYRMLAVLLTILLAGASLARTVQLNFFSYTDARELYVHVQTTEEIMEIDAMLKEAAKKNPVLKHQPILVVKEAIWPISWLFFDFTRVVYTGKELPYLRDGILAIVDPERVEAVKTKMRNTYFVKEFQLNPGQPPTTAFFDREIFAAYFDEDAEIFEPLLFESAGPQQGLVAEYYDSPDWEGPVVQRDKIDTIDLNVPQADEREKRRPFSASFKGEIFIPVNGVVHFFLASDDGSALQVDGKLLIDNMKNHPEHVESGFAVFAKGWYPIEVRYFDSGGNASCRLWWKLPGGNQERISPEYLRPVIRD